MTIYNKRKSFQAWKKQIELLKYERRLAEKNLEKEYHKYVAKLFMDRTSGYKSIEEAAHTVCWDLMASDCEKEEKLANDINYEYGRIENFIKCTTEQFIYISILKRLVAKRQRCRRGLC